MEKEAAGRQYREWEERFISKSSFGPGLEKAIFMKNQKWHSRFVFKTRLGISFLCNYNIHILDYF